MLKKMPTYCTRTWGGHGLLESMQIWLIMLDNFLHYERWYRRDFQCGEMFLQEMYESS